MYIEKNAPLNKNEFFSCSPAECRVKIKKIFSNRFKELRIEKSYTQSRLAQVLHISRSCLCTWEHAVRMPDLSMFYEICTVLDVPPDYMLGLTNRKGDYLLNHDLIYCNKATYLDVSKLNHSNLYQLVSFYNDLLSEQRKERLKEAN